MEDLEVELVNKDIFTFKYMLLALSPAYQIFLYDQQVTD
jgi:hypothetical protein